MASSSPKTLYIINQESLSQETEGVGIVHYVVKNNPFVLIVGNDNANLMKIKFSSRLVYDFEEGEEVKEVPFIKHNPMEYRGN